MTFLLLLQFAILSPLAVVGQRVLKAVPLSQDTATTVKQDSVQLAAPQGDIETTIKYSARDSILFEVGNKVVNLYGDAKINYGTMSLEAAYIQINYETNTLTATTLPDSTGKETGTPLFTQGSETYAAKRIAYNYKTKKGRISEVVTQQGEGYIHAEVVKKNQDNEFFGLHAQYTTCNLEHPHFYIGASKMKGIPNDKVMTGPFNLVIGDIPTPIGFLFGLFPTPRQNNRASGVIVPSFGESRAQGFYLSNGGYYFAWNDYIGTRLTGDVYSLGGYNIRMDNTYRKRYAYSGNLGLQYQYFKNDEADVERSRSTSDNFISALPPTQRTIWINWSHTPTPKPGQGRFSASVNAGSNGHQRLNYNSPSQYLSPTFNSNISYQKNIENTPFSYTAKLSQSQSIGGVYNFVLPDLNFSMTPISFFEILTNDLPTGRWYEQFTLGYNVTAQSRISNVTRPAGESFQGVPVIGQRGDADTISLSDFNRLWENGQRTANHNLQLNLGSYKLLRYFNFSPSVNYRETWSDEKYSFRFDPDSQKIAVDTTNFGRVYEYSAGASLSTTIYGTVYFKEGKRIQAIRHLIRPSLGYSYRPDFGRESFGFYQRVQTTSFPGPGQDPYRLLPRLNNAPGIGLQNQLSFNIQNNLEMKVRSKNDSTDQKFEKIRLIDNLSLTSAYNFAADSLKLSPINMSMNTNLFKIFNVNFTSTFEPYKRDSLGRQVDEYVFDFKKLKLANLTNANFSVSASFNPEARRTPTRTPSNLPSLQPDMDPLMPDYVDFKIPWTLSLDYTIGYYKRFGANADNTLTQTLGLDGSLNLTENWKITYFASYDFANNNIANARLQIYRDLHCWEMSIGWIPYGFAQGYNITINAKSSLLQDLRLTKNRSARNNY
ncbi:putative LPS assembly protein LptD [Pontibacter sp. MBLB2868]|uniref:putative LPS assembly protein LptD n=1 Tax=Pontibacter sp. MBLB2868 TaxID=3451555 RepID=UPI003F756121